MWTDFLTRVWGNTSGWAFTAFSASGQFKHKVYKYPEQFPLMVTELKKYNTWANIYFCPHLFKENRRQKDASTDKIKVLWIDKDVGPVTEIVPKPTICWESSENKYQAIWILDEEVEATKAEAINKYLTYKSKGDKGGWHLGKVIRLPESINYKYQPNQTGKLLWSDGPTYLAEELEPLQNVSEEMIIHDVKQSLTSIPSNLPKAEEIYKQFGKQIPPVVWNLLNSTPSQGEDWSENLWKLEKVLIESGLPLEAVYVLVEGSPWNKYKRDKRPPEHLWADVTKAYHEVTPSAKLNKGLPWTGIEQLMHFHERPEWLVKDIWMDKNVGWIAGVGKSYKSTISIDLALSVASGHPFLGKYEVLTPGPVLMVQEEDPVWRVAHRTQVIAKAKGISVARYSLTTGALELEFKKTNVPLFMSIGGNFLFKNKTKVAALEEAIAEYNPRMVIMDPLFMMTPGMDEYKAGEITEVLNLLKYWRNTYGCSIAIVHHYKKGNLHGNNGSSERLYGSMALYAWSENSLFVSKKGDTNLVYIEKDIKDALTPDKTAVEFRDIDEKYDFVIRDDIITGVETTTDNKTVAFLVSGPIGQTYTRKQIAAAVGVTEKTVSKILAKLEEDNKISIEHVGKGGAMKITTLPHLYEGLAIGGITVE